LSNLVLLKVRRVIGSGPLFYIVIGERYYKLSIIGSSGYPYTLGTMDQFLTGQFHENLELAEANTCTLRLDASGAREVLICDLVLEAKGSDNVRDYYDFYRQGLRFIIASRDPACYEAP
jgi:hypothetical protein